MNKLNPRLLILTAVLTGLWASGGCYVAVQDRYPLHEEYVAAGTPNPNYVVVDRQPPAVYVESRPACPSPNHIWIEGYWAWRVSNWVWIGGHWGLPPRHGGRWVPHFWARVAGGWEFHGGHWR